MTQNRPGNSTPLFDGRPLTGASEQEVGQAAIDFTLASNYFTVLSGTPQVVHTRRITAADYPALDLGQINFIGEEPPLLLVVLKGDFDTTNFGPSHDSPSPRTKTKYIAYVFDLFAGLPTLTAAGLTGEYFRRVLKDSSIPDEAKELIGPEPGMREPIPEPMERPTKKLPYGTEVRGEPTQTLTEEAIQVIVLATKEAERLGTTHPGTEHLLLGLIEEDSGIAAKVLNSLGITLDKARIEVEKVVDLNPKVATDETFNDEDFESSPYTYEPRAEASLSQAEEEARQLGCDFIGTEHLLLGLVQDEENPAARVLANMGVKLSQIRTEILRRLNE